jgi:hypothetical protein
MFKFFALPFPATALITVITLVMFVGFTDAKKSITLAKENVMCYVDSTLQDDKVDVYYKMKCENTPFYINENNLVAKIANGQLKYLTCNITENKRLVDCK